MQDRLILIIEDDDNLRESLVAGLSKRAHVLSATTFVEAANILCKHSFDLVIADYQLSDGNGCDLIRSIRENSDSHVPIILITGYATKDIAIDAIELRVVSLIEKPFTMEKLLQTVDKHLRSVESNEQQDPVQLNHELRCAIVNGEKVELTSIEFKLLALFYENKNKQLLRSSVENHIWGNTNLTSKNILDTHLYNLKKKIPILKENIKTIHGSGMVYRPYANTSEK